MNAVCSECHLKWSFSREANHSSITGFSKLTVGAFLTTFVFYTLTAFKMNIRKYKHVTNLYMFNEGWSRNQYLPARLAGG